MVPETRPTLVLLYGQPAAGKLTVARALATLTGLPVFHNHLVVDALAAVFPFGSAAFVTLRERFWLDVITAAIAEARSLVFTFAPEASVAPDFPARLLEQVTAAGGTTLVVGLKVSRAAQAARVDTPDRAAFGKLRSHTLLADLQPSFDACLAAMPAANVQIDTDTVPPAEAAAIIAARLNGP